MLHIRIKNSHYICTYYIHIYDDYTRPVITCDLQNNRESKLKKNREENYSYVQVLTYISNIITIK